METLNSAFLEKSILYIDGHIAFVKLLIPSDKSSCCADAKILETTSNLLWTDNIADIVELIYAIHQTGSINKGDVTIKEIVEAFEHLFGVKILHSSHTFGKIVDRTGAKTQYLNRLLKNLNLKIGEKDL